MKLKKLFQLSVICCGILALAACSTTKHGANAGDTAMAMNDANGGDQGAQAQGIGNNENFNDQANGGGTHGLKTANRTYYFDFDKYDVRESDKAAILANADWLASHPNSKVILEGHTDPRGSREYNVALGENRAKAVLEILQSRGVNPNQIRVVSYGAERPAALGHNEHDFQLDRRAIIAQR